MLLKFYVPFVKKRVMNITKAMFVSAAKIIA